MNFVVELFFTLSYTVLFDWLGGNKNSPSLDVRNPGKSVGKDSGEGQGQVQVRSAVPYFQDNQYKKKIPALILRGVPHPG